MLYNDALGIEFLEYSDNHSKARLKMKESHINAIGFMHGGVTASLIDTASGYLASAKKYITPTNNMTIYFTNPIMVSPGDYVYAESRIIKRGKSIIVIDSDVYDNENKHCAHASLSFSVLGPITDKELLNEMENRIKTDKEKSDD